jgi:transposase
VRLGLRFRCGKQIGCYVGLIPCEESSANRQRLGHITKQGNSLLRFLLLEAAQAAVRSDADWRREFLHLTMRRMHSGYLPGMPGHLPYRQFTFGSGQECCCW